jgi:hypothetical protein
MFGGRVEQGADILAGRRDGAAADGHEGGFLREQEALGARMDGQLEPEPQENDRRGALHGWRGPGAEAADAGRIARLRFERTLDQRLGERCGERMGATDQRCSSRDGFAVDKRDALGDAALRQTFPEARRKRVDMGPKPLSHGLERRVEPGHRRGEEGSRLVYPAEQRPGLAPFRNHLRGFESVLGEAAARLPLILLGVPPDRLHRLPAAGEIGEEIELTLHAAAQGQGRHKRVGDRAALLRQRHGHACRLRIVSALRS